MPEKPKHSYEDNLWVGGQIRTLRKNLGMSQTDLAQSIGDVRYQKYISDYENGIDHMPISVFFAIMDVLHATPSEMLPPRMFGKELTTFEKFLRLSEASQELLKSLIEVMLKAEGKD